MKKKPTKESPLERLVKAAQEKDRRDKVRNKNLPVKLEPKSRFNKPAKILTPIVEDNDLKLIDPTEMPPATGGIIVTNSSLTMNFNFNIDDKTVDRAIATSKQVAKGIAAAGAAMLGTAFLLKNENKTVDRVKIPLIPKVKVPKIEKRDAK